MEIHINHTHIIGNLSFLSFKEKRDFGFHYSMISEAPYLLIPKSNYIK